jgi:hypothetical protein
VVVVVAEAYLLEDVFREGFTGMLELFYLSCAQEFHQVPELVVALQWIVLQVKHFEVFHRLKKKKKREHLINELIN